MKAITKLSQKERAGFDASLRNLRVISSQNEEQKNKSRMLCRRWIGELAQKACFAGTADNSRTCTAPADILQTTHPAFLLNVV